MSGLTRDEPLPGRGAALLVAAPALLAGLLGAGGRSPLAFELLGLATLVALGVLAWRRLRRAPAPRHVELLLALGAAESLALSLVVGGRLAGIHPGVEGVCRRLSVLAALVATLALATLAALPRLRRWWGEGVQGLEEAAGDGRAGRRAVVLAWALVHLPLFLALPPLVQYDSWTNAVEPGLFVPVSEPFHHPPVYVLIIHAACRAPSLLGGLSAVVLLQHALVLGMALWTEALVRRTTRDLLVAAVAGCAVAVEGSLLLYAQLVMTEIVATAALVAGAWCLVRAEDSPGAARWVAAAGACAALATLTRQVAQLWFVIELAWLLGLAGLRGRSRAAPALLLAAVLPVLAVVGHHWVFLGRASFTASTGRDLIYRLTPGMPDLTDPQAPPGDELERARRILWAQRGSPSWYDAHAAMKAELGWDDRQITAAVQRLYVEQARKYPLQFARISLEEFWGMLRGWERWGGVIAFHDRILPEAMAGWEILPAVGGPPGWVDLLDPLAWTHLGPVLLLAGLSPLLARGRSRRLALLALASAAYLIAIPALVEQPLPRYRLPACPFIALAAALGLAGARARLQAAGPASPSLSAR